MHHDLNMHAISYIHFGKFKTADRNLTFNRSDLLAPVAILWSPIKISIFSLMEFEFVIAVFTVTDYYRQLDEPFSQNLTF
jgi:hypothetical protein